MRDCFLVIKHNLILLGILWLTLACVPEKSAPTVPMIDPPDFDNQVDSLVTVWLKDNLKPLAGIEPQPTNGDLLPFATALGSKPYVLLGESATGTMELAGLKQRLISYMVSVKDFKLVLIEMPFQKSLAINAFVLGGSGDAATILDETDVWWMSTLDMVTFVNSLRAYNQTVVEAEKVRVLGMDMLQPAGSIVALSDYLQSVDAGLATFVLAQQGCFLPYQDDAEGYFQLPLSTRQACAANMQSVVDTLTTDVNRLAGLSSEEEAQNALQHALIVVQAEQVFGASISGSGRLLRQRSMAINVKAFAERFSSRAVVWTDNYASAFFPVQNKTLAANLTEMTSDADVLKVGMSFFNGELYLNSSGIKGTESLQVTSDAPFASCENYIATTNRTLGYLSTIGVSAGSVRTDWLFEGLGIRQQDGITQTILSREFDLFFYVETCSPSRLFVR
ncbi:MAG: erythromycin esterase family protein [Calditrichia bacterium]